MSTYVISRFWCSDQHAKHLREFGDDPAFVTIKGKRLEYTACRSDGNSNAPFDGALELFPDYKFIGYATMDDVSAEEE